jgi:hypothetical protein
VWGVTPKGSRVFYWMDDLFQTGYQADQELWYNIGMKEDEVDDVIVAFLVFIGFVVCLSIGMVIVTIF